MPPKIKKQIKKEIQAFDASEFEPRIIGDYDVHNTKEIKVFNEQTVYYHPKNADDNKIQELMIREKSTGKIFEGKTAWVLFGGYDFNDQYDVFVKTDLQKEDKILKKKTAKTRQSKAREEAIKAWEEAKQNCPKIFHTNLNGPTTDRMLNEVEKKFNCKLPEGAREVMKVHNGRRGNAYCQHEISHPFFILTPVEEWIDFFTAPHLDCPELEDEIEQGDKSFIGATKGRSLLGIGIDGEHSTIHLNTTTGQVWQFIANLPEFSLQADSLSEYIANAEADYRLEDDDTWSEIASNKRAKGVSKFYTETKEFFSDEDDEFGSENEYKSEEENEEEPKIKEKETKNRESEDAEPKAKHGKQTKKAKEESEEEDEDEDEDEEEELKPRGKKTAKKAAAKKRKDDSEEDEEEEEEEEKPKKQTKGKKAAGKKKPVTKYESEEDEEEEEKPKKQAKGKKAAAKKRKDDSEEDEEEEEEDTHAKKNQKKGSAESLYKIHIVNKDTTIPDFASSQKISGNTILYKATKAEEISTSKSVLVHDIDSNKWLEGAKARKLIGVSTEEKGKVYPKKWPNHEIFIQSTSYNRKVSKSDKLIFL